MNTRRIVQEYVEALLRQDEAVNLGISKDVRKWRDEITRLEKRLLQSGEAIEEFSTLLNHPETEIRANVATLLLGTAKHNEAMAVLRELARGEDIFAWAAGERIREWQDSQQKAE